MLDADRRRLAVVLLGYGGPRDLDEVEAFLSRVMAPRRPSAEAVRSAQERYRLIGGGSPLVANSRAQAAALEQELERRLSETPGLLGAQTETRVFLGMRSSEPFLEEAVREAADWGGRLRFAVLASHGSEGATGAYRERVAVVLGDGYDLAQAFVSGWHLAAGYLEAVADRIESARADAGLPETAPVLFTAHSLPFRDGQEEDQVYRTRLEQTVALLAEKLRAVEVRLAFQSAAPRPGVRWMGPFAESVLEELAAAGHTGVVVAPLGFVSEHLETLYDLDIALKERARELGVRFARANTVGTHPRFIAALAEAVLAGPEEN